MVSRSPAGRWFDNPDSQRPAGSHCRGHAGSAPRPTAYDRWRDAKGIHVDDGCRVEQVEVAKEHGALRRRLGKRGVVTGRRASNRLYVHFECEVGQVSIRPHLVRVLAADAETPRNVEQIIAALRALAAEHGCGVDHHTATDANQIEGTRGWSR